MAKGQDELRHDDTCKGFESFFLTQGYDVKQEVALPNGRGAADLVILDRSSSVPIGIVEVKGQPTSLRQKKIARQFQKYQEHFGSEPVYLLGCPNHEGELELRQYPTNEAFQINKLGGRI